MNGTPTKAASFAQSSQFTIGKLDAGIAVLISDCSHIVEFPSLLLPSGSIVSIACSRDVSAEEQASRQFWQLQESIVSTFGVKSPAAPKLKLRNVTQTAVTLEWDALDLATAKLLSLTIFRNGQRLAVIPNPTSNTSTKLSGLEVDSPYTFHLVLKTSAGTFSSNQIKTKTHTIANTSGIRVCFGTVSPPELLDQAKAAITQMHAAYANTLQIDTTHFVCTSPGSTTESPNAGQMYQKALHMSIPTVLPSWLEACAREEKMVPIAKHYLGANTVAPSTSSRSQRSQSTTEASAAAVRSATSSKSSIPSGELAKEQPARKSPLSEERATAAEQKLSKMSIAAGLGITADEPETPSVHNNKTFEQAQSSGPDSEQTNNSEERIATPEKENRVPDTPATDGGHLEEVDL